MADTLASITEPLEIPAVDEERLSLLPKRKQDKVLATLRDLKATREANPLLFYRPHVKQRIFHGFTTKRKIFLGGNQSGKTTAGVVDSIIQAVDTNALPGYLREYKHHHGAFRCWMAAPGREQIEDYIYEKIKEWVPLSQLVGESWNTAFDKSHNRLNFKNGSYFQFKTYEQETNKWGGSTLDRVLFDEEPPLDKFGEGRIRTLRREGSDLLFTMTPTEGLTYMFDTFQPYVEKAEAGDGWASDDRTGLVLVDMDDNPVLDDDAKEAALEGFTNEERLARKSGKFVALHGLIYPDFDPNVHEIGELEADEAGAYPALENSNIIVGIDPGIRHACGVLWTYLTPDDVLVAFEEGYYKGMTIAQVCEEIHKVNTHYDIAPIYYVIDPAARNRQSQTGRSDQMEFADHHILTIAGQNEVRPGINRVKERMQTNRFYLTENCENLKMELKRYRWRKPPRTENEGKEVPVKRDDHLVDPLRYICMSRPYLPKVKVPDNETGAQKFLRSHVESVSSEPVSVA